MSEGNKDDVIKNDNEVSEADTQSKVDENNTTQEINQPSAEQNTENQPNVENNEKPDGSSANNLTQSPENDNKEPENQASPIGLQVA